MNATTLSATNAGAKYAIGEIRITVAFASSASASGVRDRPGDITASSHRRRHRGATTGDLTPELYRD